MEPNLRNKIEEQLSNELMDQEYDLKDDKFKFDWSELFRREKLKLNIFR